MPHNIKFSAKTKELLQEIKQVNPQLIIAWHINTTEWQQDHELPESKLIKWLSQTDAELQIKDSDSFWIAALRATLLHDLLQTNTTIEQPKISPLRRLLFPLLVIAGTLGAVFEGFDGIMSILEYIDGISIYVKLGIGVACSALALVVFYGFDINSIAETFGITITFARKDLDVLTEQNEAINKLILLTDKQISTSKTAEELHQLHMRIAMLIMYQAQLAEKKVQYHKLLQHPRVRLLKVIMASCSAVLFFSSGFFAGQAVGAIIATLIFGASPLCWPVLVLAGVMGALAVCVYIVRESPGIQNLIGRWFDLNEDKIKKLPDDTTTSQALETSLQARDLEIKLINSQEQKIATQQAILTDQGHRIATQQQTITAQQTTLSKQERKIDARGTIIVAQAIHIIEHQKLAEQQELVSGEALKRQTIITAAAEELTDKVSTWQAQFFKKAEKIIPPSETLQLSAAKAAG